MLTLDLCLSIITIAFWISLTGATTYNTSFKGVTWDDDNWRITNTVLDQGHYQSRLSLANGYLGINVAAVGPFFEADIPVAGDNVNGWPLFNRRQTFSTISGFWDSQPTTNGTNFPWFNQYGGESVISGVPHWAGLLVLANGSVLNASVSAEQISGFTSILDIGSGLHRWQYTWTPEDEPSMDVVYSMFVHKLHVSMAVVQLKITPSRDANLTILDVLDGDCAVRTSFVDKHFEQRSPTIWSASKPLGLDDITAYVYSTLTADCDMFDRAQVTDKRFLGMNESSIAQSVRLSLLEGQTATIEKYVGAASSDAFGDPQAMAHSASIAAASIGFTMLLHSHRQEWESVMPADSVDDFSFPENGTLPNDENIVEQQILAVTNSFYLLQNTIGTNAVAAAPGFDKLYLNSIPVCGLGSDCYGGQIFWDADVWMASGLVLSHPQSTQQITNYRVAKYPQARENVKGAFASSQNRTRFTGGAVYPWTSALFGNCTGTGPCFDYEYHLNGDIGMLLFNYFVTSGDLRFWKDSLFPIHDDLAYFYGELVRYNRTSDTWYLKNATDPDEYANHIDNPGFTMALIATHLQRANNLRERFGLTQNETWARIMANITLPISESANIILEYSTMNDSIEVKQADVSLIDDLLHYDNNYTLSDLEYYANLQAPGGPGMTYSAYSIVSSLASESGRASYTFDRHGSKPYLRGPWFQYSEQILDDYSVNGGTHPAFPFLTGMGAANPIAVMGYLGFHFDLDSFSINPQLPPQISHLQYRTIYWQGHAINVTSNQKHTTLSRIRRSLPNANATYHSTPINVTVSTANRTLSLDFDTALVVDKKRYAYNLAIPDNMAQCSHVYSEQDYEPGQVPLAAVDGAISTYWQPKLSNTTASITVDLRAKPFQLVTGFYFDWAQNPPTSYAVHFSNASSIDAVNLATAGNRTASVSSSKHIKISHAYNATEVGMLLPYSSNHTNVTLEKPVWSGRYATLSILGNQGDKPHKGATVAEWAIIGSNGSDMVRKADTSRRRLGN